MPVLRPLMVDEVLESAEGCAHAPSRQDPPSTGGGHACACSAALGQPIQPAMTLPTPSQLRLIITPAKALLRLTRRQRAEIVAAQLPSVLGNEGRRYWLRRRRELGATASAESLLEFAELCAAQEAKKSAWAKLFALRKRVGGAHISSRENKLFDGIFDASDRIDAQLDKLGLPIREPS